MANKKQPMTGMERLVNSKEKQLKTLENQLARVTASYQEEKSKLDSKIRDAKAIISALKGKK